MVSIDIKLGDILLGGRFKNKRIAVKRLGTDDLGQPSMNSRPLLNYRIEKKLPVSKQSSKTREGNMDKTAEDAYQFGLQDELEKVAKARPLSSALVKLRALLKGAKPAIAKAPSPIRQVFRLPGELTPERMAKFRRIMRVKDIRSMRTPKSEVPLFLRKGLGSRKYL